ncbi:MAG: SH3 domain-containing protein [Saprospiraceae bacterium]|nr:SH3 domain-containing protein [Saprospiraceae bacterium]
MISRSIPVIAFMLWVIATLHASDTATLQQAAEAYQAKDFRTAANQYEALISAGYTDAGLYYNLGNCYAAMHDRGRAILNYEKALRIKPYFRDARHNLMLVSQPVEDVIAVLPPFFLVRWLRAAANVLTVTGWAVLTILLSWVVLAMLIIYIWFQDRLSRSWSLPLGILTLSLLLFSAGLGWYRNHLQNDDSVAVVMQEGSDFKYAPEENSETIHALPAGTRVELVDTIGAWYKVILTNKDEGWVEKSAVEHL